MKKSKPARSPSLTEKEPDTSPSLDASETARQRTAVGLLLYLSPDREDIHRDVPLLTRKLKEPDEFNRRRLVKAVRYLKGTRTFGIRLTRPTGEATTAKLDLYTDTDFAGGSKGGRNGNPVRK